MLVDVVAVVPHPDFSLELEYANGERRLFDMKPLLQIKPWDRLNAWPLFRRVQVAYGTVAWPGDLDVAPETLYDNSLPVARGSVRSTALPQQA